MNNTTTRPAPKPAPKPIASLILFADAYPDGNGGFLVKPRAPRSLVIRANGKQFVQEIGSIDACKVLGISRASIHDLVNDDPEGRRRIKWRFNTGRKGGKRLFEVQSLLDFIEWTRATLE